MSGTVKFAEEHLLVDIGKCKCNKPSKATPIRRNEDSLIVAYVCPDHHVSRVVYFGVNPDVRFFDDFLRNQLGERVRARDFRRATRYGWEFAGDAERKIPGKITQIYWTFYAKNEDEKGFFTILCSKENGGCGKLFTRSNAEKTTLCPVCSQRRH